MREVTVKELNKDDFEPYGFYANMINPDAECIGEEPIEFYRDMVQLDLAAAPLASFSTCRVTKRDPVVDVTESHSRCGEGILPLDGDILIHVAPATPKGNVPAHRIEVFCVPQGTMVTLRPGVWHHGPFAHGTDCVNVLIVLPERTYANDCDVAELSPDKHVRIK